MGHTAKHVEHIKRNKKPPNRPDGDTMERRVANAGKEFYPVGFETFGAFTSQCTKLIKKLSEEAHRRRGHDKASFRLKWTVQLAMTIAKRGAQTAVSRIHSIARKRRIGFVLGATEGPLGTPAAEPFVMHREADQMLVTCVTADVATLSPL